MKNRLTRGTANCSSLVLILYFLPIVSNTLLEKLEDKMLYFLTPRILFGKLRL